MLRMFSWTMVLYMHKIGLCQVMKYYCTSKCKKTQYTNTIIWGQTIFNASIFIAFLNSFHWLHCKCNLLLGSVKNNGRDSRNRYIKHNLLFLFLPIKPLYILHKKQIPWIGKIFFIVNCNWKHYRSNVISHNINIVI